MPIIFWIIMIIILAATTIASFLLRPKFTNENRGPDPFAGPTIEETRPIMVVWGTVKIDNPAVIWWGDLNTRGWNDGPVTYAYSYHVGISFGLGFGPMDDLEAIWYGDRLLWSGSYVGKTGAAAVYNDAPFLNPNTAQAVFNTESATGETTLILSFQQLYGGIDSKKTGAEGGIFFVLSWHNGSTTQNPDWYLDQIIYQGGVAYRGYSYIQSRGPSADGYYWDGYTGLSGQLKKIAFKVRRCPAGPASSYRIVNTSDANPVNCLYELYTDTLWGAGIATSNFDTTNWQAAALICYNEGLGVSWSWETSETIEEIQNQLLALMDGAIFTDLATGQIRIKLARADYVQANVPVFDMSSAIEISEFARGNMEQAINEVRVEYVDRDNQYLRSVSTPAQDLAHIRQTGVVNKAKAFYPVSTATNAQKLALRDLRASSAALYRGSLKVNRRGAVLIPGDVFRLDWAAYGVSNLYMRVVSTSPGTLLDGRPIIRFVQDVFSLGSAVYNGPPPTNWEFPLALPVAPYYDEIFMLGEGAPHFFVGLKIQPMVFAVAPNNEQLNYDIWAKAGSAPVSGGVNPSLSQVPYTPYGQVYNLSLNQPGENLSSGIDVANVFGMEFLVNCTSDDIRYRGRNLFVVFDPAVSTVYEIASFEAIQYLGNDRYRLTKIRRALADTAVVYPFGWPDGHKIYFIGYGYALLDYELPTSTTLYLKLRSRAAAGISGDTDRADSILWTSTALNPCPPQDVRVNGNFMPRSFNLSTTGSGLTLTWKNRRRTYAPQGRLITQDEASHDMTGSNIIVIMDWTWLTLSVSRSENTAVGATSASYTIAEMRADVDAIYGTGYFNAVVVGSGPQTIRLKLYHWDSTASRYSAQWDVQLQVSIS